jgi:hypothetical protein
MNCPFCHRVMQYNNFCNIDKLSYWSIEELERAHWDIDVRKFVFQHPNEPAYWFHERHKFYTVPQMERIARLKAFL